MHDQGSPGHVVSGRSNTGSLSPDPVCLTTTLSLLFIHYISKSAEEFKGYYTTSLPFQIKRFHALKTMTTFYR